MKLRVVLYHIIRTLPKIKKFNCHMDLVFENILRKGHRLITLSDKST